MDRRLRHEGDLSLTPAGVAGIWHDETPARFFLINIAPRLMRQVADEMGIEGAALCFEPVAQFRDAQIATLAWALKLEVEAGEPNGRPYIDGLGVALGRPPFALDLVLRRLAGLEQGTTSAISHISALAQAGYTPDDALMGDTDQQLTSELELLNHCC